MRGLAIETSGRIGSIALGEHPDSLAEIDFPHGLQHAAEIIPLIDRLCRERGWSPRDIEQLYLSAGPGSFTGLRIAVTLAKMLALATGVPLVAVPSVRVLVENAPAEARHLLIVLDAKRDQIYTARFERDSSAWAEREPAHLDRLDAALARAPRPIHLLGEGIPYHQKFIPTDDPSVVVTAADLWRCRAGAVWRLGTEMAGRGEFTPAETLTPIYIRLPEAEEKYLAAQGKPAAG